MVNLDMIGRMKENKLIIGGTGTSPTWEKTIKELNIDKLITKETGLPVQIAEDPLSCVAIGTGKALEQEETFSTMLQQN